MLTSMLVNRFTNYWYKCINVVASKPGMLWNSFGVQQLVCLFDWRLTAHQHRKAISAKMKAIRLVTATKNINYSRR